MGGFQRRRRKQAEVNQSLQPKSRVSEGAGAALVRGGQQVCPISAQRSLVCSLTEQSLVTVDGVSILVYQPTRAG